MTWQEYQTAVANLYKNMGEMGIVKENIHLPDKITGQARQIDVWWELNLAGHKVNILIDAKYRKDKIDIKDLEEVEGLANAVGANKIIIVTNNGWTKPSIKRANYSNIDLKILDINSAFDLIFPNKWFMCYDCHEECVIMDSDGVLYRESLNLFFDWYAGKCRSCSNTYFHCPECGQRKILENGDEHECSCTHIWKKEEEKLFIKFNNLDDFQRIDNAKKASITFLHWMLGYDVKYWRSLILSTFKIDTDEGNSFSFMIGPNGELVKPDYEDEDGPVFYFGL